ncbi:addiction module protein [Dyella sp.]
MNANLFKLPVSERIRLVEDLWDSSSTYFGTTFRARSSPGRLRS